MDHIEIDNSEESRPPPITGTPESGAWFLAELEALGMTRTGFAKWLKKRGDDRSPKAIERHVQRMAAGQVRVSGEMRVILRMMRDGQRKAMRRKEDVAA